MIFDSVLAIAPFFLPQCIESPPKLDNYFKVLEIDNPSNLFVIIAVN